MNEETLSIPATPESDGGKRAATEAATLRVLLVTGMSGAGKSTTLKALEDIGYEAVDNVPLSLLEALVTPSERPLHRLRRPLAIGADIRTRDFGIERFIETLDHLAAEGDVRVRMLFLDCDDEELHRRFTATRRRHPLAEDRSVTDGIAHERALVSPLRTRADLVVDTSELEPGALKRILKGSFGTPSEAGLSLFVTSFAFRFGLPREADLVFDVRFLTNPHYDPGLRPLTGLDAAVAAFIVADDGFPAFFDGLTSLLAPLIPRYAAEGKSYLTVAVGCTGGRHRSVFVAEKLAGWLRDRGHEVEVAHRDLGRSEPLMPKRPAQGDRST